MPSTKISQLEYNKSREGDKPIPEYLMRPSRTTPAEQLEFGSVEKSNSLGVLLKSKATFEL